MKLASAICRGLGIPDKPCDIELPNYEDNDLKLVRAAVAFFAQKRHFKPKSYKSLPLEEIIYRLQQRFPEFCLLCFWFQNGISKQQDQLIDEHGLNWLYTPADLMKAYWQTGLCKTLQENRGPVWPIEGYSKAHLNDLIHDPREWETLWSEPIVPRNGHQVVGYALYYTELLSRTIRYQFDNWKEMVSFWLWNDEIRAVSDDVHWPTLLMKPVKIGQGKDVAYRIIQHYLGKRYPHIFAWLERDTYWQIVTKDIPLWHKNILLQAYHEGRDLTPAELQYIDNKINTTPR